MSRRRGRRPVWTPPGVLALAKPAGPTSHDMVAFLRGLLPRGAKVGHAGTLDPFAEGVLPLCLGGATRLADHVGARKKTYYAELDLSASTDTGDPTGEVTARAEEPAGLNLAAAVEAAREFTGEIMQTPPAYSAVRVGGKRAYALARAGETPSLKARPVTIHEFEVLELAWPRLDFRVTCSRGTYVRTLGEDLGVRLGCRGHLTRLVREAVGPLRLEDAVKPFDLLGPEAVVAAFVPLERVIEGMGAATVARAGVDRLLCGAALPPGDVQVHQPGNGEDLILYPDGASLPVAMARREEGGMVRPVRVFGLPPEAESPSRKA